MPISINKTRVCDLLSKTLDPRTHLAKTAEPIRDLDFPIVTIKYYDETRSYVFVYRSGYRLQMFTVSNYYKRMIFRVCPIAGT